MKDEKDLALTFLIRILLATGLLLTSVQTMNHGKRIQQLETQLTVMQRVNQR